LISKISEQKKKLISKIVVTYNNIIK